MSSRRVSVYGKKAGAAVARAEQRYASSKAWLDVSQSTQSDESNGPAGADDEEPRRDAREAREAPADEESGTVGPRRTRSSVRGRASDSGISAKTQTKKSDGKKGAESAVGTRTRKSYPPRSVKTAAAIGALEVEFDMGQDDGLHMDGPETAVGSAPAEKSAGRTARSRRTSQRAAPPAITTVAPPAAPAPPKDPYAFPESSVSDAASPPKKARKRRSGEGTKPEDIAPSSPVQDAPPAKMRELQFYRHHAMPTAVKIAPTSKVSAPTAGASATASRGRPAKRGKAAPRPLQFATSAAKPNPAARVKMVESIPSLPGDLSSSSSYAGPSDKENMAPGPKIDARKILPSQLDPLDSDSSIASVDVERVIRGSNAGEYADPQEELSSPLKRMEVSPEDEDEEEDLDSPTVLISPPRGNWRKLTPGPGPGPSRLSGVSFDLSARVVEATQASPSQGKVGGGWKSPSLSPV